VKLDLPEAYQLSRKYNNRLTFGGVVIPERHMKKGDEHLRVIHKINNGCTFFVSQATYNLEASKNFLSDYYYFCNDNGLEMVPILFNLTPCGSAKTLEFMKWLGISIPIWLENELKYSNDVLDRSVSLSLKIFEELLDFAQEKGIPIGCSVESVSTRKVEIEASVQLVRDIKSMQDRKLQVNLP
jgi:5,10-methylenetetrahydrofolate reductase